MVSVAQACDRAPGPLPRPVPRVLPSASPRTGSAPAGKARDGAREAKAETPTFRVHFVGGDYADIAAETPLAARRKAEKRNPDALIAKVKILREEVA